jgi:hypothetical protein
MKRKEEIINTYCDDCKEPIGNLNVFGCWVCHRDICWKCGTQFQLTWGDDYLECLVVCDECMKNPSKELMEFLVMYQKDEELRKQSQENLEKMRILMGKIESVKTRKILNMREGL